MRLPYHKTIIVLCFIGFLICLALIVGGCASSRVGKGLNVGVLAAGAADVVSTQMAIAHGGREANPLVGPEMWRQVVAKVGGVGAILGLAGWTEGKGHAITAHLMRSAAIAVWSAAAVHNFQIARR